MSIDIKKLNIKTKDVERDYGKVGSENYVFVIKISNDDQTLFIANSKCIHVFCLQKEKIIKS